MLGCVVFGEDSWVEECSLVASHDDWALDTVWSARLVFGVPDAVAWRGGVDARELIGAFDGCGWGAGVHAVRVAGVVVRGCHLLGLWW